MLLALACAFVASASAEAEGHRYAIQPEASELTFNATSRFMNALGRFLRLSGEVVADPADLSATRIALTIDAASIDTGIRLRDNHLRSADFFDVRNYPTITFESTGVEGTGRHVTVSGRLTLHGVTRDIAVPVDVTLSDIALVATGEIVLNRGEYGMTYNSTLNPIGNEVRVNFTFRARTS